MPHQAPLRAARHTQGPRRQVPAVAPRRCGARVGRRGTAEGRLHWTANFDEVQDFERDIRDSFGGAGFLPDAVYNLGTRKDPLGDRKAGLSPELDALAAYLGSLDHVNPSPFRNPDGMFTDDAKEGRRIFQRAGCPTCHTGADFTDSPLGGLHDVGTILPTSGKRLGAPLTGFDVPTLKGVWENAPYLHDGRAATLKEIFVKYNPRDQLGHTSSLSDRELDELVAYLEHLDDVPEGGPLRGRGRAILGAVAACGLGDVVVGLLARLRQRRRSRPDRS